MSFIAAGEESVFNNGFWDWSHLNSSYRMNLILEVPLKSQSYQHSLSILTPDYLETLKKKGFWN